jgi:hypothetical protein
MTLPVAQSVRTTGVINDPRRYDCPVSTRSVPRPNGLEAWLAGDHEFMEQLRMDCDAAGATAKRHHNEPKIHGRAPEKDQFYSRDAGCCKTLPKDPSAADERRGS